MNGEIRRYLEFISNAVGLIPGVGWRLGRIDSLPTCDETIRGVKYRMSGAAGAGDRNVLCRKDTANAYAWADSPFLADPGADRITFWDESANDFSHLSPGAGLTISGTTMVADPTLDELDDVTITSVANGQHLAYLSGWKNADMLRLVAHAVTVGSTSSTSSGTYQTYLSTTSVLPAGTWNILTLFFASVTQDTDAATVQINVSAPVDGSDEPSDDPGGTTLERFGLFTYSRGDVVSDGSAATTFTGQYRVGSGGGNAFARSGLLVGICRRVA